MSDVDQMDWPDGYRPACPACGFDTTGLQDHSTNRMASPGINPVTVVTKAVPCGCDVTRQAPSLLAEWRAWTAMQRQLRYLVADTLPADAVIHLAEKAPQVLTREDLQRVMARLTADVDQGHQHVVHPAEYAAARREAGSGRPFHAQCGDCGVWVDLAAALTPAGAAEAGR
ncbi:MAG TPA: hypothetical protein VFP72_13475 [Kineosporiaceae bacterium]|nr:hypothetical protein [Kineosporiaceae bacterium]